MEGPTGSRRSEDIAALCILLRGEPCGSSLEEGKDPDLDEKQRIPEQMLLNLRSGQKSSGYAGNACSGTRPC